MKRFISKINTNDFESEFERVQLINEETYINFKKHLRIIEEVDNSLDLFLILEQNYREIIELHNGHFKIFFDQTNNPLELNNNEYTFLKIEVNRIIINYLSSFRMLVDHYDRVLNKQFGKSSNEYKQFIKHLSETYDNYFEYRFVYKLRNFCQHCGLPVTEIIFEKNEIYRTIELCFNKTYLLNEYDSWSPILKEDFTLLEEKFPVNEIVERNFEIMRDISELVRNIYKDHYFEALEKIDDLSKPFRGETEIVIISEVDLTEENYSLQIDKFPFNQIDEVLYGFC